MQACFFVLFLQHASNKLERYNKFSKQAHPSPFMEWHKSAKQFLHQQAAW